MTHQPAVPTTLNADGRPADDGEDSIEFAEFTGNDDGWEQDAAEQAGTSVEEVSSGQEPPEIAPPAWFKPKTESSPEATTAETAAPKIDSPEETTAEKARSRQRRKRRSRKDEARANSALIETNDEPEEPLDWKKDWKKILVAWIVSTASCGYGVSLIFHTMLLAGMSAIVFSTMDNNQSITTIITEADAMPIEFTEIMDLTVEPAGSSQNQLPQLTKIPITTAEAEISSSLLDSTASNAGNNGEGGDTDEGFGFMFSMPEGGKVVSKGSFSAWTVPEDPEPRKDYMIVIRIKLPEKTKLYRISDLSGKVEGSDLYVQHLPFDPNRRDLGARSENGGQITKLRSSSRLRVIKNHVQIMIPVKGGNTLVRDTIHIKSRMLKEDQKLEIVF